MMNFHNPAFMAIAAACLLTGAGKKTPPPTHQKVVEMDKFFNVLAMQESSGLEKPKDGDSGRAIGPFQIWYPYWMDATQHDKSIGGTYQDCRKRDYAEKVVIAYMDRYCHYTANVEEMARIHNAGPSAFRLKKATKYWLSFQKHMNTMYPEGIVKKVPIAPKEKK